jgi:hypothetical protein
MVRIVDKKGAPLALDSAAICQLSGHLYALGDQGVGHGLEIGNRQREVAKTHRAMPSRLSRRHTGGNAGRHRIVASPLRGKRHV